MRHEPNGAILDFRGRVLTPADRGYDEARRVWNGAIDRKPALIAQCADAADVAAAIRHARERDLLVSVRGGGHGVAGHAVNDGGLVIDLGPMKGVRVDAQRRRARVEPGVLWGELDEQTQRFGMATTGGIVSHTGVAGLTLGGGLGWLMRKHSITADNLIAADVVTADGHTGARERGGRRRAPVRAARRRWKLRRRDLFRVCAARDRDHTARGPDRLGNGTCAASDALLPRFRTRGARRADDDPAVPHAAATSRLPAAIPRAEGVADRGGMGRTDRGRRARARTAARMRCTVVRPHLTAGLRCAAVRQ